MKKFFSLMLVMLLAITGLGAATKPVMPLFPVEIRNNGGEINGVIINTANNADFPLYPNMLDKEMEEQIAQIVKYLYEMGVNSIFYEAVSQFDAMYSSKYYPTSTALRTEKNFRMQADPLKLFCQEAAKYSMDVYAMVTPYDVGDIQGKTLTDQQKDFLLKNTFESKDGRYLEPNGEVRDLITDVSVELAKKYPLKGIIFKNLELMYLEQRQGYSQNILWQFADIQEEIDKLGREISLGIFYNGKGSSTTISSLSSALLEKLSVDLFLPKVEYTTQEEYTNTVQGFYELTSRYAATLVTVNNAGAYNNPTDVTNLSTDPFMLNYQMALNNRIGAGGMVLGSLSDVLNKFNNQTWAVSTILADWVIPEKEEFSLRQELNLNIPETGNIYTTKNTYYLTGIAEPNSVLYINSKPFYDVTETGVFGVELEINQGENEFVFSQNDKRYTVTIYKSQPPTYTRKRINEIERDSVYPKISQVVSQEEDIVVSCIAPAGSQVTATLDAMSAQLTPVQEERTGYPVEYRGTLKLQKQYAPDTIVNIGKVSYAMTYNGKINVSKSQGNILISGKDANLVIQVDDYVTPIFTSQQNSDSFTSIMRMGAKEYVDSQWGNYYKLRSGGYIKKDAVKVLEGYNRVENAFTSAMMEVKEIEETITLTGTHPPHITTVYTDNSIIYTFYNTTQLPDIMVGKSKLFKNIMKVKVEDNTYQLHFIFHDGMQPWGYDYKYVGIDYKDTVLTFRYPPHRSSSVTNPLTNISVLLDAGHGGEDMGKQGVAGLGGPGESQLNLAVAEKTKELLESLGATVQLTRYEDKTTSQFDRMRLSTQMQPDFYISIHHNGVEEGENGDNLSGVKVSYYHNQWSGMAEQLAKNVSHATDRTNLGAFKKQELEIYNTDCPALLIETGYLSNPKEYNTLVDSFKIYQTACGIVNTIVESLEQK